MSPKRIAFLLTFVVAIAIDRIGKAYAMASLGLGERVPMIGDVASLTHERTAGGGFGLFRSLGPEGETIGLAIVSLVSIVVVISFQRGLAPGERGAAAALGAIAAGVLSNGFDRLHHGEVIDFLHLGAASSSTLPDFNVADVAIVMGVATLIVELLALEMASRVASAPGRERNRDTH